MSDIVLELNNLTCGYDGNPIVNDLSLHLRAGDIGCLLGPSGCGKTTTLRSIAGFEPVNTGEIRLQNKVLSSPTVRVPPEQRRIGMVFQDYALFPHLTVADNIAFGISKHPERQRIIGELLELVNLDRLGKRYPHELSGGQQQRVAVARALLNAPEVVYADEPTGNLDSRSGAEVLRFLRDSTRDLHQTIVMVTHDPVAAAYADRVVFLRDGRLVDEVTEPTAELVSARLLKLEEA